MNNNLNKNFSEIRNGFSALEGQDKLVYLIDLGKKIEQIDLKAVSYTHLTLPTILLV